MYSVKILDTKVNSDTAEVTATVSSFITHREIRDGKKFNFKVNGEGTYVYTLVKEGSSWKISGRTGNPDFDKSTNELIPAE